MSDHNNNDEGFEIKLATFHKGVSWQRQQQNSVNIKIRRHNNTYRLALILLITLLFLTIEIEATTGLKSGKTDNEKIGGKDTVSRKRNRGYDESDGIESNRLSSNSGLFGTIRTAFTSKRKKVEAIVDEEKPKKDKHKGDSKKKEKKSLSLAALVGSIRRKNRKEQSRIDNIVASNAPEDSHKSPEPSVHGEGAAASTPTRRLFATWNKLFNVQSSPAVPPSRSKPLQGQPRINEYYGWVGMDNIDGGNPGALWIKCDNNNVCDIVSTNRGYTTTYIASSDPNTEKYGKLGDDNMLRMKGVPKTIGNGKDGQDLLRGFKSFRDVIGGPTEQESDLVGRIIKSIYFHDYTKEVYLYHTWDVLKPKATLLHKALPMSQSISYHDTTTTSHLTDGYYYGLNKHVKVEIHIEHNTLIDRRMAVHVRTFSTKDNKKMCDSKSASRQPPRSEIESSDGKIVLYDTSEREREAILHLYITPTGKRIDGSGKINDAILAGLITLPTHCTGIRGDTSIGVFKTEDLKSPTLFWLKVKEQPTRSRVKTLNDYDVPPAPVSSSRPKTTTPMIYIHLLGLAQMRVITYDNIKKTTTYCDYVLEGNDGYFKLQPQLEGPTRCRGEQDKDGGYHLSEAHFKGMVYIDDHGTLSLKDDTYNLRKVMTRAYPVFRCEYYLTAGGHDMRFRMDQYSGRELEIKHNDKWERVFHTDSSGRSLVDHQEYDSKILNMDDDRHTVTYFYWEDIIHNTLLLEINPLQLETTLPLLSNKVFIMTAKENTCSMGTDKRRRSSPAALSSPHSPDYEDIDYDEISDHSDDDEVFSARSSGTVTSSRSSPPLQTRMSIGSIPTVTQRGMNSQSDDDEHNDTPLNHHLTISDTQYYNIPPTRSTRPDIGHYDVPPTRSTISHRGPPIGMPSSNAQSIQERPLPSIPTDDTFGFDNLSIK